MDNLKICSPHVSKIGLKHANSLPLVPEHLHYRYVPLCPASLSFVNVLYISVR